MAIFRAVSFSTRKKVIVLFRLLFGALVSHSLNEIHAKEKFNETVEMRMCRECNKGNTGLLLSELRFF